MLRGRYEHQKRYVHDSLGVLHQTDPFDHAMIDFERGGFDPLWSKISILPQMYWSRDEDPARDTERVLSLEKERHTFSYGRG